MEAYLKTLTQGESLTYEQAQHAMDIIMNGNATDAQIACFLTAMRMKGETSEEIAACAFSMRSHAARLESNDEVIDIVGTGGDCSNSFNVSTCSAFVVAAAGIKVAKHVNRSVSSRCGAADVLEALGVKIDITPEENNLVLENHGLCFMFAPMYHTAMKHVACARKQMGVRTIFNILGPLANPAHAQLQMLGVYSEEMVLPLARVLMRLGIKRASVVFGQDGLDEISMSAPTTIARVLDGEIALSILDPRDYGFTLCQKQELVGGDAQENAEILIRILEGEQGAKRDIVVLNSAVAISTAKPEITLPQAIELAKSLIDSGAARKKLSQLIQATGGKQTQ